MSVNFGNLGRDSVSVLLCRTIRLLCSDCCLSRSAVQQSAFANKESFSIPAQCRHSGPADGKNRATRHRTDSSSHRPHVPTAMALNREISPKAKMQGFCVAMGKRLTTKCLIAVSPSSSKSAFSRPRSFSSAFR